MRNDERFVWEYFDEDDNMWHEYGDNVCLKIETVHHSNASVARMKIHGVEYEIRLNERPMNQCNMRTNKISPIRRMIVGKHQKRPSAMKLDIIKQSQKRVKYEWRYKEGFNRWRPFSYELNAQIENAFRADLERYRFTMNRYEYEIQFHFLRALNLETKEYHEISRRDVKYLLTTNLSERKNCFLHDNLDTQTEFNKTSYSINV